MSKTRQRKVDINSMTLEQVDDISIQLGTKIKDICQEAVEKANKLLSVYGLSAKMSISLDNSPNSDSKTILDKE